MTSSKDSSMHSAINLKGSAQMVAEFFYYGVNSILYQRGIYVADSFKRTQKYGTTILVTADEKLNNYLNPFIAQVEDWLTTKGIQKLIVVIAGIQTGDVLERWQFDVTLTDDDEMEIEKADGQEPGTSIKSEKKIRQEIADVIRQVTASVTFLPLLEIPCSFDILLYTDRNMDTPNVWTETAPSYVINSREVQLRQFSTGLHAVDTKVTYKAEEF